MPTGIEFELSFILIPYFLFLFLFAVFAFFNLYHIIRFGVKTTLGLFSIVVFGVGTFYILVGTMAAASEIDWNYIINITL